MERFMMLAVRPNHAESILDGRKTVDIRRRMPSAHLPIRALLYATGKGVVGECIVRDVMPIITEKMALFTLDADYFEKYWQRISERSCMNVEDLLHYLSGRRVGWGLLIEHPKKYQRLVNRNELRLIPQPWVYMESTSANAIREAGQC